MRVEMSRSRLLGASLLAMAIGALLSWFKGQDTNWDLLNYHHYVAYAFLHDRLGLDLAAAGMQSYFNPSLDIPIYWLTERLDARLVGGLVGAWHALVFVFTLLIAREVWPSVRLQGMVLTSLAGVFAPAFWGGLGNSMGDNAAAVLALAALWCAVRYIKQWSGDARSGGWWLIGIGGLLGLCTALKLTNASVAFAVGLAVLIRVRTPAACLRVILLVVPAGLLGFALGGGWWFHQVWQQFGNPFFPQFGTLFPSELAESVAVADRRFIPETLGGYLLRPMLMPFKYEITSEFFVLPLLWPMWFVAGLIYLAAKVKAYWRADSAVHSLAWRPEQKLVLSFVLLAVVFWEALFGIYRYTAAMEPLLPLCVVLLIWRTGRIELCHPSLRRLFIASMACTLLGGSVNWGHTGWAERSFRPASAMRVEGANPFVLMVGNGNSWLIPLMNPQARYASVGSSFRFGQHYDAEIVRRAQAADRVYAVVGMSRNWRFDVVDKANDVLGGLGALNSQSACHWLGELIQRTRPHTGIERCVGGACAERQWVWTMLPADQMEFDRRDQASMDEAMQLLRGYSLAVNASRCTAEGAYLGQKRYPFRLCVLERIAAPPENHQ